MTRNKRKITLDQRAAQSVAVDNPHLTYLRINRQEICRREINAAIRLFLVDEDPISAHLLASAATEIMAALSKGKPGVGLNDMRAFMKSAGVSSDQSDELFQSLLHPYNFLKHSSSDASIENDFSLEHVMVTIYTAIHSYKVLFGSLTPEMLAMYGVVQSWRTEWWKGQEGYEQIKVVADQMGFEGATFDEMLSRGRDMLRLAKSKMGQ